MAGLLRAQLEALPGAGALCWFGDHVPIMPEVYRTLGAPVGHTDYFIWQKDGQPGPGTRRDLKVEQLGCLLLQEIGLLSVGGGEWVAGGAGTAHKRGSSSANA